MKQVLNYAYAASQSNSSQGQMPRDRSRYSGEWTLSRRGWLRYHRMSKSTCFSKSLLVLEPQVWCKNCPTKYRTEQLLMTGNWCEWVNFSYLRGALSPTRATRCLIPLDRRITITMSLYYTDDIFQCRRDLTENAYAYIMSFDWLR